MKKFLIFSLILGGIILTGCSQKQGPSQNELFEKKKECASYKSIMENEGKSFYGDKYIGIIEIFYSPQNNSCLYIVRFDYIKNPTDTFDMGLEIHDFFTKKTLGIATPESIKKLKGE